VPAPLRRLVSLGLAGLLTAAAVLPMADAAGAPGRPAGRGTRLCGLVRSGRQLYQADETRGVVPCRRIRRVTSAFLNATRLPTGWHCFRNNASSGQPFAASCARGRSVVVRIYAPT
jgi:hypothetical protein